MFGRMDAIHAIGGGVIGAGVLTAIHESARRVVPGAPRVDVIGMRAIRRPIEAMGKRPPRGRTLHKMALGGDLIANAAYYALVGVGRPENAIKRGLALGLAAGLGAALLPPVIGLGRQPHRRTPATQLMTVAWYTLGGLAAAGAYRLFGGARE